MATETFYTDGSGFQTNTEAAVFIPEIWSDEVIAAYEKNLVLAPLVRKLSMVGKKGDTIHIPKPARGSVAAKAARTAVTIQNDTATNVDVVINKHYEYSMLIEDITEVQALASMRQFYTSDAGYALAKQVDDDLFLLGTAFGNGGAVAAGAPADWVHSNCYYVDGTNGIAAYAQDTVATTDLFTDLAFRELIEKMDEADVPMDGRFIVIPPSARKSIMGIDRYVSTDFVNGKAVVNGKIGNLYGLDVYLSNNCPEIESVAENAAGVGPQVKGALLGHRDTMVLAEQKGVRSQTQYKQEYLGTLYTADRLYGTQVLRPETGFILALPTA
jgi:N4-gp56 family major capsid protein